MKKVEPHLKRIKEEHKDDKEKQAREMMALYKEHNIKPFASFILVFIQLPVILALYWVFKNQSLPNIDPPFIRTEFSRCNGNNFLTLRQLRTVPPF
jgi:YidC/Oxa1 family membrane protein insertase